MNETFMKEKSVLPLILSMALPMVISMLVNSLYNIVDSFFVAKISENAMTALSLVYPVQNFINAVGIGFGIGINAVIAFYLGAKEERKANIAATLGLVLGGVHGIVLTAGSILIMPSFLRMFTSDSDVVELGLRYSYVAFAFSLVIVLGVSFEKIFQSVGRMKVTMVALMSGCIANIILDPLLIFGLGPFPQMGMEGAALATGLGQVLTLVIYLAVCKIRPLPLKIGKKYLAWDGRMVGRLYSIGIPAILNIALPSLLVSALNGILAAYGQIYVVILGIYYKLQTFLYLPANGIIQGMRPVIGYNYGAGEYKRVGKIYNVTLGLCAVIMVAGTAICLAVPGQLIGLFTQNQETVEAGAMALRIISGGFIVSSVSVASSGALEGLGKGTPSLIISLCRYVVIIIPAAFILSRFLGEAGVWHGFWLTEIVTAVVSFLVYKKAMIQPRGGYSRRSN
ncbi:putative MATE family efflux protein [Catenibacillus scindens]|uniref:Probable multidrug resistance protein NorM n=1 Tax=Catenibacillus scindens TaxID=673271 RepID=A0A7W8HCH5_9FIRM|nr:MATE family efflux transporter [Catenibacillus scindens]MBB5265152.1 putative MATE family efflux protein [Catenibacillus scindens]